MTIQHFRLCLVNTFSIMAQFLTNILISHAFHIVSRFLRYNGVPLIFLTQLRTNNIHF